MSESCIKKVLGIFTVQHHHWGPWRKPGPSTTRIKHTSIRQCLDCPKTQEVVDFYDDLGPQDQLMR